MIRTFEAIDITISDILPGDTWECPRCHNVKPFSEDAKPIMDLLGGYCDDCVKCGYIHEWHKEKRNG